jgi:hypothetical protein
LKRNNQWPPRDTGSAYQGAAQHLHPNDSSTILEVFWDLFRQGVITLGINTNNPGWPYFRLSRFGENIKSQSDFRFVSALREPMDLRLRQCSLALNPSPLREPLKRFARDAAMTVQRLRFLEARSGTLKAPPGYRAAFGRGVAVLDVLAPCLDNGLDVGPK